MHISRLAKLLVAAALPLLALSPARADDQPVEVQVVDAFNAVFGTHPGFRANHAKGIVAEGSFTPTPEAAKLSKAEHFQSDSTPITIRFSDGGGLPEMPDAAPGNPHGMAVKFHLQGGADTDLVAVSLKDFPVASAEEFRDLLLAVAASPPGSPTPTAIETFMGSHPAALKALGAPMPLPTSFAAERYGGFNAFRLTALDGTVRNVRYKIVPVNGPEYMDAATAKAAAPDVLLDELKQRLTAGPARFRLLAQIAAADDPTNNATLSWPDTRPLIVLGEIDVNGIVQDSAAAERPLLFLPGQLTDGIEASDDPMIDQRDAAYAVSFSRRNP